MTFTFEDYLNHKISAPVGEWYDPNGNSPRAVVTRMRRDGYFAALKWELKDLAGGVKYFLTKEFKGVYTPVVWFLQLATAPFLLPVVPFTRTRYRYRRALEEYRRGYAVELKRNCG
jgi:hypothetical protein